MWQKWISSDENGVPNKSVTGLKVLSSATAVPFLITGWFRMSDWIPTFLPFAVFGMVGGGLMLKPKWRAIGIGTVLGALLFGAFLLYLFFTIGSGMAEL